MAVFGGRIYGGVDSRPFPSSVARGRLCAGMTGKEVGGGAVFGGRVYGGLGPCLRRDDGGRVCFGCRPWGEGLRGSGFPPLSLLRRPSSVARGRLCAGMAGKEVGGGAVFGGRVYGGLGPCLRRDDGGRGFAPVAVFGGRFTEVWIPAPFPTSSSLLSRQGQALRGNDGGGGGCGRQGWGEGRIFSGTP